MCSKSSIVLIYQIYHKQSFLTLMTLNATWNMSQENEYVEANAPSLYRNEAARIVMTPQPTPGASSYHPQPPYHHTPAVTLYQPGFQPAYTVSPHVPTSTECQRGIVRMQPMTRLIVQENVTVSGGSIYVDLLRLINFAC